MEREKSVECLDAAPVGIKGWDQHNLGCSGLWGHPRDPQSLFSMEQRLGMQLFKGCHISQNSTPKFQPPGLIQLQGFPWIWGALRAVGASPVSPSRHSCCPQGHPTIPWLMSHPSTSRGVGKQQKGSFASQIQAWIPNSSKNSHL